MVFLGGVELGNRSYFRNNGVVPDLLLREFRDDVACRSCLLGGVREDDAAVLRAVVVALPVQRRGVMDREKRLEHVPIGQNRWVKRDLDDLRVARVAVADFLVGGIRVLAARVAGHDGLYALEFLVRGLDAPEATAAKCRDFRFRHGAGTPA